MATKPADVDISLFQVGRLEDSSTVSSQKIAWINYDTNKRKLHIQTPAFVTETYGIPRLGTYYQTDRSRAFFKMPLCGERARLAGEIDYGAVEQFYKGFAFLSCSSAQASSASWCFLLLQCRVKLARM